MSIHGTLGIVAPFIKQTAFKPSSRQEDNVHILNSEARKLRLGEVRGSSKIVNPSPDQNLSLALSSQSAPLPSLLLAPSGDTVLAMICRQLHWDWSCPGLSAPGGVFQQSPSSPGWMRLVFLSALTYPGTLTPSSVQCLSILPQPCESSCCPFYPMDDGCC